MISKKIAVLQSNYIPWKGYFDIIHDVDLFIFYDDLQYTKNDWRNRNKIKTDKGTEWITVPAGSDTNRLINEIALEDSSWQKKHWKTIRQHYGKCSYFSRYEAILEDIYLGREWTSLSELNHYLIRVISSEILNITTEFRDSREFRLTGKKLDRLLELLRKAGATSYLSGPAAKAYIDASRFAAAGIELIWKDYSDYPEYPQRFPPFAHGVSILDLIFNTGPDASWYIWGWRDGGEGPA